MPATGTVGVATHLSASVSGGDGSIAKVEFYDIATLIGTDTSAPYDMLWTPATPGPHNMTRRATDNRGAVAVSSEKTSRIGDGIVPPSTRSSATSDITSTFDAIATDESPTR